jgi:hypothetical protein
MALRVAAGIRLGVKKKFTINFIRKYMAKHKIKDVSHLFDELEVEVKSFKEATEKADIDAVLVSAIRRIAIETEIEEDFRYVNETKDIFVREVLDFLKDVHSGFVRLLGKLDRNNILYAKLVPLIEKYNLLMKTIIPILTSEDEMLRKVTIGRYMIGDAVTFRAFVLKYLQLRLLIKSMKKSDARAKTEEKKVLRDLDHIFDLLKSNKPEDTDRLISHLSKHLDVFDKAVEKCVNNAYTVTRLTVILKHQLQNFISDLKTDISKLETEGFPKEETKLLFDKVNEVEKLDKQYAEDDYAEARSLTKISNNLQNLKAA